MKKRDKYLIGSIAAVVIYAVATFVIGFFKGWTPPDVLTGAWYAFFGSEIWHCANIKIKEGGEEK